MKTYRQTCIAFLILGLQACTSDSNPATESPSDQEQTNNTSGQLINQNDAELPTNLPAASRSIIFDYAMPSIAGTTTKARAQLFEPNTQAPEDRHPLVVWAHGTTGKSNACTPSTSFGAFGNATAINALLSEGYAVLAPDYEGFGTPSIHPYYVKSSHANSITASIPAVHRLVGTNLSDDWAIVGHSQGGHVALAAARAPAMPAYPLQAAVALAPGTDLRPLYDQSFAVIDQKIAEGNFQDAAERIYYMNIYATFVAHALSEVIPEFEPASIFGETIAPLINTAVNETICGVYANAVEREIREHIEAGGTALDFQGLKRDWYEQALVASHLLTESLNGEVQTAPLLVIQGTDDEQIPLQATSAFVDQQRSIGTDITYQIIGGTGHAGVAFEEFSRIMPWLNERFPAR